MTLPQESKQIPSESQIDDWCAFVSASFSGVAGASQRLETNQVSATSACDPPKVHVMTRAQASTHELSRVATSLTKQYMIREALLG